MNRTPTILRLTALLAIAAAAQCVDAQPAPAAQEAPLGRASVPAAALASPPADAKDAIVFRNGDSLFGALQSIEADGSIRWQHPDALEPIEFIPGSVSEIQFGPRPSPPFGQTNGCKVHLTNQDEVEGNLVSCDSEKLILNTWYAGPIEIPRSRIQFVAPSPIDRAPVFEGPRGIEGWTLGKVSSAVPNSGDWKYKNGAFYASRSASIARDLKLPDLASIQFDLNWKGLLYIAIALYTDYLQPINLTSRESEPDFGGFYSLQLYNYAADLLPVTKQDVIRRLGQAAIPTMIQKNKIHLEIRVNKAKHTIALMADGALVKQWIDPEGFVGSGSGMRFVHQGQGAVKLSNLRITEWDGQFEEKPSNSPDSPQDLAKLLNGDRVAGTLDAIRDGKMSFTLSVTNRLDIPMERVKLVEMAGQKSTRAKEEPSDVQAVFRHGGSVTLRLEKWNHEEVVGVSPNFGRLTFKPAAFERVQFNLPPTPKPTARAVDPPASQHRKTMAGLTRRLNQALDSPRGAKSP